MYIDSEEQLRGLYAYPKGRAKDKLLIALEKHSINGLCCIWGFHV